MTGVGNVVATMGTPGGLMPSPWKFKKHGQCGMEISELFPHNRGTRRRYRAHPFDERAQSGARTGPVPDEHRHRSRRCAQRWQLGHLRARHRKRKPARLRGLHRLPWRPNQRRPQLGQRLHAGGLPGHPLPGQRTADCRSQAARHAHSGRAGRVAEVPQQAERAAPGTEPTLDSELSARIYSYELAYKMQSHAMDAIDIAKESAATREMYGVDDDTTQFFGRQALMARRLVERGVRYVQIFSGGGNFEPSWDAHWDLKGKPRTTLHRNRQANCRSHQGPQEPRSVRFHPHHLAQRVRPAADFRTHGRPRSQCLGLQRLAGWRRRQGRYGCRRH